MFLLFALLAGWPVMLLLSGVAYWQAALIVYIIALVAPGDGRR